MKKTKTTYRIIFDTSALLQGDPIRKAVIDFVKKYSSDKRFSISFFIPEVVKEELKKNVLFRVKKAATNYKSSIAELVPLIDIKAKEIKIDEEIINKETEDKLQKLGFNVIPTPIHEIDLRDLLYRAVYYLPPFQEKREKGFKDCVIAETIFKAISGFADNEKKVIIIGDKILRDYLEDCISKTREYRVFESVADFESSLKLQLLNINDKFIERLAEEAAKAFSGTPDGLFFKSNLKEKIQSKFRELFEKPKIESLGLGFTAVSSNSLVLGSLSEELWIPKGEGTYETAKPIFVKKRGEKTFSWKNTLLFKREYIKFPQIQDATAVEQYERVYYLLEFVVEWQTTIQDDGRIKSSKINDIKHVKTTTEPLHVGIPRAGAYISTPTASGQGTVPIGWSESNDDLNFGD